MQRAIQTFWNYVESDRFGCSRSVALSVLVGELDAVAVAAFRDFGIAPTAMLLSAVEDVKRRIADGQPAFDPTLNDEVVSPVTAWIKVRNERGSDGVL